MDNIQISFSISDLSELTGINAHSIRIWERRYNLLEPVRTDSNIRRYNNDDLRKLLNISLLLKEGLKISELASYSDQQLNARVNSMLSTVQDDKHAMNELKMAMLSFDTRKFEDVYNRLSGSMSFYNIFLNIMIPFLDHIGSLWQTNSISVAHEHYVSNLLRQKLFFQVEKLPMPDPIGQKLYVLFLPIHELHELGLLFIHYTLLLNGYNSIYLGPDVGLPSLEGIPKNKSRVFVTYLTITPAEELLPGFFTEAKKTLLGPHDQLHALGHRVRNFKLAKGVKNIFIYSSLKEYLVTNNTLHLSK
ncbi:MAG: MerR family transcriptional regulator [Saprospiraceae bacterium]